MDNFFDKKQYQLKRISYYMIRAERAKEDSTYRLSQSKIADRLSDGYPKEIIDNEEYRQKIIKSDLNDMLNIARSIDNCISDDDLTFLSSKIDKYVNQYGEYLPDIIY